MGNMFTIAMKDLKLLWRDKLGLFWVLAFPLIMALFFGSVFGGQAGTAAPMKIAVVDQDQTESSRDFIEHLDSSEAIDVVRAADGEPPMSADAARNRVRRGELVAYVIVPAGFGDSTPIFGGESPVLEIGIDPSRRAESGYLKGLLMEASFQRMQELFTNRDSMQRQVEQSRADVDSWDINIAQKMVFKAFFSSLNSFLDDIEPEVYEQGPGGDGFQPVKLEMSAVQREQSGPASAFEISFPQAMLWGVIGTCAGFAITFVRERKEGTLLRLRTAPQSEATILAGKAMACFLTCIGCIALLTIVATLVLGMRLASPGMYVLAAACTSFCFVGLMMVLSVLGRTEEAVAGSSWGVLLICSMLGGGMIPLIAMPGWMQQVSGVSPVKWGILALEGAVWRGFSMQEMIVPCAILLGVGAFGIVIGSIIMRRTMV